MAFGDERRYLDLMESFSDACRVSFERKQLQHTPPDWVEDGSVYFLTICLEDRRSEELLQLKAAGAARDAAAAYQKNGIWWVNLLVLMPDHLHALISFNQRERSMSKAMQSWKRFLNREVGLRCQRGYFDHRIRGEDALREKAMYLRNNPVRAGLVSAASAWPYIWTSGDLW
jgi:REP element-mobilizing transposase RayT